MSFASDAKNNVTVSSFSKYAVIFAVIAVSVSCKSNPTKLEKVPIDPSGFTAFPSARSFDPPGQIYRRTPDGVVFRVSTLDIESEVDRETLPDFSSSSTWSLQSLLNFTGASIQSAEIKLADLKRERSAELTTKSASREYLQDDSGVDSEVIRVLKGIPLRDENVYFVIRETISVGSLQYKSSKNWVNEIGAQAKLKETFGGSINFGSSGDSSFTIDQDFDSPRRVWYKAEPIDVTSLQSGGEIEPEVGYLPVPDNELQLTGSEVYSP